MNIPDQHPANPHSLDLVLYKNMVQQAGDAIIFIDTTGAVQEWNRGAEKIFGYSADEARHNSLDVIIPTSLRQAHWLGFERAVQSGRTKHGDKVLTTKAIHKDGHKLYVDLHFCLVKDESGNVAGALAIGRDCTERYLAEKARRAAASS